MRSYRHKKRCAHDGIIAHGVGGEHYWGGWYPLRSPAMRREYYKAKNYYWWSTIHRWDWRFVNDIDRQQCVISNMAYTKWRKGSQYTMWNCNHVY